MNSINSESTIIAALAISIITIIILLSIVVSQFYKIKDLTKPRYGFLGKPLAVVMVGMLSIFTITGFGYYQSARLNNDVSVSDPVVLPAYLDIRYTAINSQTHLYRFNAVPVINTIDWGTEDVSFSTKWTIQNSNTINKTENIVNKDFPGGIIITLEEGLNTVTVEMNINGTIYVESLKLRI